MKILILGPDDRHVLDRVAPDVFDRPLDDTLTNEFLSDPRHHLAVAIHDGAVVGMISALHYVHPDKPPELWINEVGVAGSQRGQGVGKRLLEAMLAEGRRLGCRNAWVLTERSNEAARRLYASVGGVPDDGETEMYAFGLDD